MPPTNAKSLPLLHIFLQALILSKRRFSDIVRVSLPFLLTVGVGVAVYVAFYDVVGDFFSAGKNADGAEEQVEEEINQVPAIYFLLMLFWMIALVVTYAMAAVGCYRVFLFGFLHDEKTEMARWQWGREGMLLLWEFLLGALFGIGALFMSAAIGFPDASVAATASAASSFVYQIVFTLCMLPLALVVVRCFMLFPALAVEQSRPDIQWSWALTAGKSWQLVLLLFLLPSLFVLLFAAKFCGCCGIWEISGMNNRESDSLKIKPQVENIIDMVQCPIRDEHFRADGKRALDENGVLVLRNFLQPAAIKSIQGDGQANQHLAYYTAGRHNVYLKPSHPEYPPDHPRNREVTSSKGCITTDQIPKNSMLHALYHSAEFHHFLCAVLDEAGLYEYADSLSSINLHYAGEGQELGWHFDHSSFAITLLVQRAESGGVFEYVKDVRDADSGEMNYALVGDVLDGKVSATTLSVNVGDLVLFRGRNSLHRVMPVKGGQTRMLVVLAYNTEPGVSLSESARMTFFGRTE